MLIDFFFTLKDAKIPVSIKEYLILMEAMQKQVIAPSLDDFYYLARMTLVKDEAHYDKFDYDKLMDRLKELLAEQKEKHEGGSKWIGTGGTSPFGNGGENPEGIRIGGEGGKRSAVKVWESRAYRDYDSEREL